MHRRVGRPRANLEQKILDEMADEDERLEAIIGEKLKGLASSPRRLAYEAACLRLTLEKGSAFQKALCEPLIKKLRGTKWARTNDPNERPSAPQFLEGFIQAHAPDFDWWKDARQGEIEDKIREQEDERIAQEHAEDAQRKMAITTKFHTPNAPDSWRLFTLAWEYRHKKRVKRGTWPTLRELKLATAIPERTLKKIITSLRPKKSEIVKEPFRQGHIPYCELLSFPEELRITKSGRTTGTYSPRICEVPDHAWPRI